MTTITALTDLSKLPNQSQEQAVFDANFAYLVENLPERARQENELVANLNAIAAGSAYAIGYVFDNATGDADPGPGKMRLSSATQNAATVMRLDLTAGGQDYTSVLDTFDASTSAVKGSIRLIKFGDLTKWMTFDITARAAPSGYRNLTVVCTGSSSASPFAKDDEVMLYFQRSGDRGTNGALNLIGTATVGSAVANIDFLNLFSAAYDKYTIEIQGVNASAGGSILSMRLANGGVVDSATMYTNSSLSSSAAVSVTVNRTQAEFGSTTFAAAGTVLTIDIKNANSTSAKSIGHRGGYLGSAGEPTVTMGEALYVKSSAVSGFRLFWSGGANFTAGTVRVYGHVNS